MKDQVEIKQRIIDAGYKAIEELIKVAEENILKPTVKENEGGEEEFSSIAADRLKNAAATKKVAIFDAFEILARIESEKQNIALLTGEGKEEQNVTSKKGFAERRSISGRE